MAVAGLSAQTIKSKSPHSDAHKQLLANQAKTKTKSVSLRKTHSSTSSTISSPNPTSSPRAGTAKPSTRSTRPTFPILN